jgi:uncharacterized membrane-anchored protein
VVVGDLGRLSDAAVSAARDVVVRAGTATRPPAVPVRTFDTGAASEDMALLLAQHATLVVTVGYPTTVEELLDRGRAGASSSLVTRAGLADRVVGARAAAQLTRRRRRLAVPALVAVLSGAIGAGAWAQLDLGAHWPW